MMQASTPSGNQVIGNNGLRCGSTVQGRLESRPAESVLVWCGLGMSLELWVYDLGADPGSSPPLVVSCSAMIRVSLAVSLPWSPLRLASLTSTWIAGSRDGLCRLCCLVSCHGRSRESVLMYVQLHGLDLSSMDLLRTASDGRCRSIWLWSSL